MAGTGRSVLLWMAAACCAVFTSFPVSRAAYAAPACSNLSFIPVEPELNSRSTPVSCNAEWDRSACSIQEGFGKIRSLELEPGLTVLSFKRDARTPSSQLLRYLRPLTHSPLIRELNRMRIIGRGIGGQPDVCRPTLLYLGAQKLFGLGPAFVDSRRFLLEDRILSDLVALEDGDLPLPGLRLLSKEALLRNGYYELAVAHELAHGLMQDLYGVDAFKRLTEEGLVSRDPHMASAITDPALAWIEGFAEGFEAYLGEKYGAASTRMTAHLSGPLYMFKASNEMYAATGWKAYKHIIPVNTMEFLDTLMHLDDFSVDFLKAERQRAIPENHFVLKGAFSHLSHYYDVGVGLLEDPEWGDVWNWTPEHAQALYSKEGAVAYLVYRILQEGLANPMFELIAQTRPASVYEFVTALQAFWPARALDAIAPTLKAIFIQEGRQATADYLKTFITAHEPEQVEGIGLRLAERLAALPMPVLEPPRALWLEFENPKFIRVKLVGKLDRINLVTATPTRLMEFIESAKPRMGEAAFKELKDFLLARFLTLQEELAAGHMLSAADFAQEMHEPAGAHALRFYAGRIAHTAACFQERCLERKPK